MPELFGLYGGIGEKGLGEYEKYNKPANMSAAQRVYKWIQNDVSKGSKDVPRFEGKNKWYPDKPEKQGKINNTLLKVYKTNLLPAATQEDLKKFLEHKNWLK